MGSSYYGSNLSGPTVWEVERGREFPKVQLCGRWKVGENSLKSNCVGGGCVREFPKVPLLGEKPLGSNCVGVGGWERIPGSTIWEVVIRGETTRVQLCGRWSVGENSLKSNCVGGS
jgi:hypothetical protein